MNRMTSKKENKVNLPRICEYEISTRPYIEYCICFLEQLDKIARLNRRIQDEVKDLATAEYKIHAVFHHEGVVNFGHYWVYILDDPPNSSSSEGPVDQEQQPRWLKYSDDVVSEVGKVSPFFFFFF